MPTEFHLYLAFYTAVLPGLIAVILLLEHEVRLWLRARSQAASVQAASTQNPPTASQDFPSLLGALRGGNETELAAALPRPSMNIGLAVGAGVLAAVIGLDGFPYFVLGFLSRLGIEGIPYSVPKSTQVAAIAIMGGGLLGMALTQRISFLTALAGTHRVKDTVSRAAIIGLLGGALLLAQVLRRIPDDWDATSWIIFSLLLLVWIALAIVLDLASSTPAACGWWPPLLFAIAFGMASLQLALVAKIAIYAQLATSAAVVCGVAMLVGIWRPGYLFGPGGTFASMLALATLALNGQFYSTSDFPVYAALLTALAPAGLALILLPRLHGAGRWAALVLALAIPGIPLLFSLFTKVPDNAYGY
ncbi:MAG: hypothetical protein ACAI35_22150 [Candidatus Methylacidiphilales bacterium]|nr:hypothetical protein [Candidatus Methylacidiphilales bacterium]